MKIKTSTWSEAGILTGSGPGLLFGGILLVQISGWLTHLIFGGIGIPDLPT